MATLCAKDNEKWGCDQWVNEGKAVIETAHTLRAEGFDASEDGTGRGTPLVPVGVDCFNGSLTGDVAATMGTRGSSETASGPQVMTYAATDYKEGKFESVEQAGPLTTSADRTRSAPVVAFSCKDHGADAGDQSPTLRSMGHDGSHANGGGQVAVVQTFDWQAGGGGSDNSFRGKSRAYITDPPGRTRALNACKTLGLHHGSAVRRLTPTECARLQGFPDEHARIPWRGKPAEDCPDGPQYKAYGNSMAVPCMKWIGERIARHLA